jgi:hypothetical protein
MASNCRKVAASAPGHLHDAAIGEDHFKRAGRGGGHERHGHGGVLRGGAALKDCARHRRWRTPGRGKAVRLKLLVCHSAIQRRYCCCLRSAGVLPGTVLMPPCRRDYTTAVKNASRRTDTEFGHPRILGMPWTVPCARIQSARPMLVTLASKRTRRRLNATEPTAAGGSVTRLGAWAKVNQLRAAIPGRNGDRAAPRPNAERSEKRTLPAPVLSTAVFRTAARYGF